MHDEKHEAYGDSWKRRGEMLGIMANIARKVDRLGGSETKDETSADTAADLMVYLAKYRVWLDEQTEGPIFLNWGGTDTTGAANEVLLDVDARCQTTSTHNAEAYLKETFDLLEQHVMDAAHQRKVETVTNMLWEAYRLARTLWEQEREGRFDSLDEYRGADAD